MAFNWSTVKAKNSVGNSRFSAAHGHFSGQHELLDREGFASILCSRRQDKNPEKHTELFRTYL